MGSSLGQAHEGSPAALVRTQQFARLRWDDASSEILQFWVPDPGLVQAYVQADPEAYWGAPGYSKKVVMSRLDRLADDLVRELLVEYNQHHSAAVRERFRPANLKARSVAAYALDVDGQVIGGCVGPTEDVWRWLTVDTMWVREDLRGHGLGRALLDAVEAEARSRGCRWSKLNTFDFQAPAFYQRCGYVEYGREDDYPPGHVNYLTRKNL